MLISTLLKYITAKRIRKILKQGLAIAGAFYFLDISYSLETILNFKAAKIESIKVGEFLLAYFSILILFYPILDVVLRFIFLKYLRNKILKMSRKRKIEMKYEDLRALGTIKTSAINFVVDYPVGLGYVNSGDLKPIEIVDFHITDQEKEEAINESIGAFVNWSCTFIHLFVTLIVVYKYYPILMICFLIIGAVLALIVISVLVVAIENIEVVMFIVARHWNKKFKSK